MVNESFGIEGSGMLTNHSHFSTYVTLKNSPHLPQQDFVNRDVKAVLCPQPHRGSPGCYWSLCMFHMQDIE